MNYVYVLRGKKDENFHFFQLIFPLSLPFGKEIIYILNYSNHLRFCQTFDGEF